MANEDMWENFVKLFVSNPPPPKKKTLLIYTYR